jgi:hypothetical protein
METDGEDSTEEVSSYNETSLLLKLKLSIRTWLHQSVGDRVRCQMWL